MKFKRRYLIVGSSLCAIGYIFSIATGSIGFLALLLVWIANYKNVNFYKLLKSHSSYFLIAFFLLLALGLSYTPNFNQGQKEVVRFLPYFILPIVFLTIPPVTLKEAYSIIRVFIFGLSAFFMVCLITALIRQFQFYGRGGVFNWYYFYRYDFLEIFSQHPTYLSAYTLLSLAFLVFWRHSLFKNIVFYYTLFFIHIIAIILYGSRAGYLLLVLLFILSIIQNLKKDGFKNKWRIILIFLCGLLIGSVLVWNIPIVKERVLYTFGYNYEYEFNDGEFIKDASPEENGRFLIWQDAIDLIKEKPLIGYGTGSSRDVLIDKYRKEKHQLFVKNRFNAHNTYLETLLIGGLPLLLSFLAILSVLFYNGFIKRNILGIYFAIILGVVSLTETIFLAQGIIFVSFFLCFFTTKLNE